MSKEATLRTAVAFCIAVGGQVSAEEPKRIGMALWAGCEDVCRGVEDELHALDPTAKFLPFDAARDPAVLKSLPNRIEVADLDLLLTWGTKVTRYLAGTKAEFGTGARMGDLPVVFTVVADPIAADIIQSYNKTGRTHITGTRNRVPETVNINGLRRVMPDFNHLGMIYEPDASNSNLKFNEMRALSADLGFELTGIPIEGDDNEKLSQMEKAIAAMQKAGVQFIYLGSSTFLETHADAFTQTAVEHGLPVLSPYENLVHDSQAYLAIAARDYDVGKLAARQAMNVLSSGKPAGDFSVLAVEEFAFVLNATVAAELDFFPPLDVLQFFEMTGQ